MDTAITQKDFRLQMARENEMDGYEKMDLYNQETIGKIGFHYREILKLIGENPEREGLMKTPERVAKAMQFLTHGYDLDPNEILRSAMFEENYKQMVLVKDIEIYSLCEHHMIPFFGKAHVAYIPNGRIVGLSKIPRVVDAFARRLQVQERLTTQIKEAIQTTLDPLGVAVVIEAQHMCMSMRGIQKQNSVTTTSDFTGAFLSEKTRAEFIHLIGSRLH
jgi:GTP cyclohydrolase I